MLFHINGATAPLGVIFRFLFANWAKKSIFPLANSREIYANSILIYNIALILQKSDYAYL